MLFDFGPDGGEGPLVDARVSLQQFSQVKFCFFQLLFYIMPNGSALLSASARR